MDRIVEPELMNERDQAEAYANADFEEPHARVIELFDSVFPGAAINGHILDLGCGPGDVTFRFAKRFPGISIIGIDGSAAMIDLANRRKDDEREAGKAVEFLRGFIPGVDVPQETYDVIISTSFLHHLHDPSIFWETVGRYATPGTKVFVYDLFRPPDRETARHLVEYYSGSEPEILKKDFYNSLLAAFEPAEVKRQLVCSGLNELLVEVASDRHLIVYGEKC
jgi:ubiquinone/menaquinone biosynthesis C-methylase UbiE